eukprot:TRINITY_DN6356_c0_g1_i1.p1 TRINITY_DN6356_c0_g1~~TRINITY_DN6356_c0_g1_i1.p1  ORF type:complete len:894 (+),score=191.79 TRINITY_DN6356_c0_g1_i1:360-2684(+)
MTLELTPVTWVPGTIDNLNLLGTIRTLDSMNGWINLDCRTNDQAASLYCTYGVISEGGWTVWDDTASSLFDDSDYKWIRPRCTTDISDWYFFGYAHDFKAALYDFTLITGKIPVPPRYAFGVFFSRWWAYNDLDTMHIVSEYEQHQTPLDVVVTDMDWHVTFYKEADQGQVDQAGQTIGWTGYTWDHHLFPDPTAFFSWCKMKGLRNTLNIHPASGVQPWEEQYAPMAEYMGVDPSTNKYVPFDINNQTFANGFLDIVLKPVYDQGIDFWWLDWQQWTSGNPNPTFMLNYVFFTNPQRVGSNLRGMLLHRWGGLGNHRYQLGFSGDVVPSWDSLSYQPYFTQTAANVLYGYWSHDIGGHTQPCPAELYTRWVQWGIWSPIFRTHCTKDPNNDRRIWTYPLQNFQIMRDAIALRSQMVPYIYTQARVAYDTGVSIVHPLFYDYPSDSDSYQQRWEGEYMFGSELLVDPVTAPVDGTTKLASKTIYLPEGTWVEWFSGDVYTGPKTIKLSYTLDEIPIFVKAGAIIPMLPADHQLLGSAQEDYTSVLFTVFPYSTFSRSGFLYEDDGLTADYIDGAFGTTSFTYEPVTAQDLRVTIEPTKGMVFAAQRVYEFAFVGIFPPSSVVLNGTSIPYVANRAYSATQGWTYNGDTLTATVWTNTPISVTSAVQLDVFLTKGHDLTAPLTGFTRCVKRLQNSKKLLDQQWGTGVYNEDYYDMLTASETGRRITYDPSTAWDEVSGFASSLAAATATMEAYSALKDQLHAQVDAWLTTCPPSS